MTKLEREWTAKLKASGFHDLESTDRDAPLSNAGKPHAKYETAEGHERLQHHLADGTAYQQAARDLLWARRWPSATDRRIWQMHVDGAGLREITATLEVSWQRASRLLHACQERMTQSKQKKVKGGSNKWDRRALKRLIKRAEPRALERLARLLTQTLTLC
jgi:hypothetical protein